MSNSPPTTLGQYQIIREIARSNDIVYEAYDPQMDRRVALKELALLGGSSEAQKIDRVQRFEREARAAGRLHHPNIMTVYQVASDGDRHYMAMEFLDGHTLRNEIDTKGFLPVDKAIEIATAVLEGLGHAHANGVVHRDIKPDNIQLLSSGEVKITDFGIARLTFQPNLTMDGQVFGTPSYMSPEQVVGRDIDARSDIFSLGVVLYEMFSGQKPFPGDSVVAITYAIMNKEPEQLTQVSYGLWQVVAKALDKSPALRYSSAQEMIQGLQDAVSHPSPVDSQPYPTMGMAAPPINPFGVPGYPQQMPAPPPVLYPYNPYQQHGSPGMSPHTPNFPQAQFPPVPVYYPPPPRQPLLKPETRHFLAKLFTTLLVMGTLFAVVILGISSLGKVLSDADARRQDQSLLDRLAPLGTEGKPLLAQAEEAETFISRLRSPADKTEQSKRLAALYERIGQQEMAGSNWVTAEEHIKRALELDPPNSALMSDLAVLYGKRGRLASGLDDRVMLFDESAKAWEQAAANAGDESKHQQYAQAAAETYYSIAVELNSAGHGDEALAALENASRVVPNGAAVAANIQRLQNQIKPSQ